MIPDQIKMWDNKHGQGDHTSLRNVTSPLAEMVQPKLHRNASILELGCGVGRDALFFAKMGHVVIATDSSSVVIEQNKKLYPSSGVEFSVLDMQQTLPYPDERFDAVFANLSLHYYLDEKTEEIFQEIGRVLKEGGILAFACKSRDEQRTAGATEVAKNVFVAPGGHATHFFTTDYVRELVEGVFSIEHLDDVNEEYNGQVSGIVRCIARKEHDL